MPFCGRKRLPSAEMMADAGAACADGIFSYMKKVAAQPLRFEGQNLRYVREHLSYGAEAERTAMAKVTVEGNHLVRDGKPFFWLADTI